jgi:hypothetical protein
MNLIWGGLITLFAIAGMLLLENWGDIQRWRDRKWEEKCNRRKFII